MNRIDNTHATFLNCLRDWNDPFLHGHKSIKPLGCQRCESCGCRFGNQAAESKSHTTTETNSLYSHDNDSNENDLAHNRNYLSDTYSKINRNLSLFSQKQQNEIFFNGFQPIVRCKSSANVPKTIDQCVKLNKSRPRPSSIRPYASNKSGMLINDAAHVALNKRAQFSHKMSSIPKPKVNENRNNGMLNIVNVNKIKKVSTNSVESDKESTDTFSKDDDFRLPCQSSPDTSSSLSHSNKSKFDFYFKIKLRAYKMFKKIGNAKYDQNQAEEFVPEVSDLILLNEEIENKKEIDSINNQINEKNDNLKLDETTATNKNSLSSSSSLYEISNKSSNLIAYN